MTASLPGTNHRSGAGVLSRRQRLRQGGWLHGRSRFGVLVLACICHGGCASARHDPATDVSQRFALERAGVHAARAEQTPDTDDPESSAHDAELSGDILTIEDARSLALRLNPDVYAARARLAAAAARVDEARARWFPTVVFSHNTARTFQTPASRNRLASLAATPPSVPVDLENSNTFAVTALLNALRRPLFGIGSPAGNANPFSEHSSALTATWVLFDGFIREAQIRAASFTERASESSLEDVRRLIVNAVDAAYYEIQLAEEQVRIARADERFSREQLEETEKLRRAGRASQADVDNFRIRMLTAQTDLRVAEGRRDTGRVILAELLGLSGSSLPPGLALSLLEEESGADMAPVEVDAMLARAYANRPDLMQLDSLLASQYEEIQVAKGARSPSVTLSGSYGFDHSETLRYGNEDQSSAVALEVRWELFTGGAREARILGAQARYAEAAARLNGLRLAVGSEVRSAAIEVESAQRLIELQRESLTTAQENRRVVQAGYVAGKESLTRLNEAQRDYITAEANLALARIRLRQAWSDLHAAIADSDVTAVD